MSNPTKQAQLMAIIKKLDELPKAKLPTRQAAEIARDLTLDVALEADLKVNDAIDLVTKLLTRYHDSLKPFTVNQK